MAATSGWNRKWSKGFGALLVLFQCVMIGFIVGEIVLSKQQMDMVVGQHDKNSETSSYRRHYALIMEQPEEQSREEIFEGCLEEGKETGAYVELEQIPEAAGSGRRAADSAPRSVLPARPDWCSC